MTQALRSLSLQFRTPAGGHETYIVKQGQYEAIYSGMPPHGLGRVGKLVPATGVREAAKSRVDASKT